ncbi:hypothetical protein AJ78_08069 [Emergomyces pasteurianus Ep9510]|uniref:Protein kinase domain-containing protein n=1 Tax=Emergomyces pasteurianus Ep9510 TaxID=1447872 RepID=A0A1J9Q579_9EURO|nr:hypothetical protein AJ78_08069 [Emergomyces pasteurianus Ep9510]
MSTEDKRSTRFDLDRLRVGLPSPKPQIPTHSNLLSNTTASASASRLAKRKSPPPPSLRGNRKIIAGKARNIALVEASRSGISRGRSLITRNESPWDTFKKICDCDLAGDVAVIVHRTNPTRLRAIRQFTSKDAHGILEKFHDINHENVIKPLQCFHMQDVVYLEVDHLPLTLEHIVACKAYPNERQLAVILTQILNGLSYLIAQHFKHEALNCLNILMGLDGKIQIARLEECRPRLPEERKKEDVLAVAGITMELMQKYSKDNSAVGIENLDRWPVNSLAVSFVSATTSADSIQELEQHPLVKSVRWSKGELVGLAWLALISARTFYSFDPTGADDD